MGTSTRYVVKHHAHKDHPHAYGDKAGTYIKSMLNEGSSPRVWGQA